VSILWSRLGFIERNLSMQHELAQINAFLSISLNMMRITIVMEISANDENERKQLTSVERDRER